MSKGWVAHIMWKEGNDLAIYILYTIYIKLYNYNDYYKIV